MDGDRVTGSARKVAGKAQKVAGEAVGDQKLQAEGLADEATGAVERSWGEAKDVADNALEQAEGYVQGAREAAGRAMAQGRRYIDDGLDMLPDAGEALGRGRAVVGREIQDRPVAALLIAGAVGYGLALLIHGWRSEPPSAPATRRGRSSRA